LKESVSDLPSTLIEMTLTSYSPSVGIDSSRSPYRLPLLRSFGVGMTIFPPPLLRSFGVGMTIFPLPLLRSFYIGMTPSPPFRRNAAASATRKGQNRRGDDELPKIC
jgi:hypothetical protein